MTTKISHLPSLPGHNRGCTHRERHKIHRNQEAAPRAFWPLLMGVNSRRLLLHPPLVPVIRFHNRLCWAAAFGVGRPANLTSRQRFAQVPSHTGSPLALSKARSRSGPISGSRGSSAKQARSPRAKTASRGVALRPLSLRHEPDNVRLSEEAADNYRRPTCHDEVPRSPCRH